MTFTMAVSRRPISYNAGGKSKYQEHLRTEARLRWSSPLLNGSLYLRIAWFHKVKVAGHDTDIDNISKPIVDALKDIVFQDDSQLVQRLAQKIDATRPGSYEIDTRSAPEEIFAELDGLISGPGDHIIYVEVGTITTQRVVFGPIEGGAM